MKGKVESVVVVGSSGAGKSTLVDGLRHPGYEPRLVIPNRYVTRRKRLNDNESENTYLDAARFKEGVKRGVITPYWTRPMEGDRHERYGFNMIAEDDDRLRIYSANNAFLRNPNMSTRSVLASGIVVVVTADSETRTGRLDERSPDMDREERVMRLRDNGIDVLSAHGDTEVIDTTHLTPQEGQLALQGLVGRILYP